MDIVDVLYVFLSIQVQWKNPVRYVSRWTVDLRTNNKLSLCVYFHKEKSRINTYTFIGVFVVQRDKSPVNSGPLANFLENLLFRWYLIPIS